MPIVGGNIPVSELQKSLPPQLFNLSKSFPSLVNIPVHWGEQDAFAYARYAETSRLSYITQILGKLDPIELNSYLKADPIGPIVKSLAINYKSPVTFPDTLLIASTVNPDKMTLHSFTHEFIMISYQQERIVASGQAVIVMYDFAEGKKALIPPSIIDAICRGSEALPRDSERHSMLHSTGVGTPKL